jgi:hypothetical protein
MMRPVTAKIALCCVISFSFAALLSAGDESGSRGLIFSERIQGSGSSLGLITKLDTAVGYQFNRYLAIEGGVPLYLINPSSTLRATTGTGSQSGIGDVHVDFRLSLANPVVNCTSMLTVGAPTGNKSTGFSTGRTTYDWTNWFDHSFSRLTPFASVGFANTIADTPYFVRPFSSFGFITHVEGGASYRIVRGVSIGASVYGIAPSGQQRVFSKVFKSGSSGPPSNGPARGRQGHQGVFETAGESVGTADIARDHGVSAWFAASPSKYAQLEIGYSRSVEYALDSVFFGVSFNLRSLFGDPRNR